MQSACAAKSTHSFVYLSLLMARSIPNQQKKIIGIKTLLLLSSFVYAIVLRLSIDRCHNSQHVCAGIVMN